MVERFFFFSNNITTPPPHHHHHHHHHHSQYPHPTIMLLSGPPSSGKTSLLFQYAYNSALEEEEEETNNDNDNDHNNNNSSRPVVFICNRRRLHSKPPFLSQGIHPSSHLFQRIQMKYVEDDEGITNYFSAFHLQDILPASVIIDDFADFFDDRTCQNKYNNPRGRDLAIVRALALSHNAIAHANETRPCKLLLSDTHHGDSLRLLYIYKRWVSSVYTIKGDGCGSFLLKSNFNSDTASLQSQRMRTAKYSIALQYLVLEGISADTER